MEDPDVVPMEKVISCRAWQGEPFVRRRRHGIPDTQHEKDEYAYYGHKFLKDNILCTYGLHTEEDDCGDECRNMRCLGIYNDDCQTRVHTKRERAKRSMGSSIPKDLYEIRIRCNTFGCPYNTDSIGTHCVYKHMTLEQGLGIFNAVMSECPCVEGQVHTLLTDPNKVVEKVQEKVADQTDSEEDEE